MKEIASGKPSIKLPDRSRRQPIGATKESLVRSVEFLPGNPLPRLYRPAASAVDLDLAEWARNNREMIEEDLANYGAILLRGFKVTTPEHFENFALAICPELFNENGEHPRKSVSGKVYTPVFYPPDKQLLWHNENSFNHRWPTRIFFCCASPARRGGETPLADSRRVYEMIDPRIREKFEAKQVMYARNYGGGMGLDWQTVFQTTDRAEVERMCRESLMEFQWKDNDRLMTRCVRPAVVRHPRTGEPTWFTQAQHWHVSCLDPETRRVLTSSYRQEDLPRNCYYGDGSEIADDEMNHILGVYQKLEVSFPWQASDIILLDNLLTAHGRNPFVGERKLLVAMGSMMSYDDLTA